MFVIVHDTTLGGEKDDPPVQSNLPTSVRVADALKNALQVEDKFAPTMVSVTEVPLGIVTVPSVTLLMLMMAGAPVV